MTHMDISEPLSAQLIDRLGVASFIAMRSLIFVCILIGFIAVYTKYKQPSWEDACIKAGGVPVQIAKQSFDCKVL